MKHKIKRRLSFLNLAKLAIAPSIVPILLALILVASPASATDYTCDGGSNPVPANVTGSVNIALISENCVIDHDVTATSLITIQTTAFAGSGSIKTKKLTSINSDIIVKAPNNSVTTKQIKAGWGVNIEAATIVVDGSITAQIDQTSTSHFPANPSFHTSVILRANGNISTGTIRTDGGLGDASVKTGGIQIDANMSGAPVEFVIGGPSANGVDGSLIATSSIGGGMLNNFMYAGVRITNGLSTSQGGIRLIAMNDIKVRATQSRSGLIVLNAQNGKLTLPTGKLNAEGMPGQMGGYIFLGANTIDMQDGTIISTNQDADATASDHHINITAETIKFRGTEGLKILADGNGLPGYSLVYVAPQNAVFPRSNNQLNGMLWTFDYLSANGLLKFDGTGEGGDTAPLLVRANGNDTEVNVAGYPINFIGGDVTLRARGNTGHSVYLGYFGALTNKEGLNIDITGNFLVDADGKVSGDKGGQAYVKVDQANLKAPLTKFTVSADGPSSGDGDGGVTTVDTKSINLDPETKALFTANAAPNGTGNATSSPLDSTGPQAVTFNAGSSEIILGQGDGHFKIRAKGGTFGGNGGTAKVISTNKIKVRNTLAVDVSAIDDGGQIELDGATTKIADGNENQAVETSLNATGGLNKNGGIVIISSVDNFDVLGVIQVVHEDGGTPAIAATNIAGNPTTGGIGLNSKDLAKLCRPIKTGQSNWPFYYWNCAHPQGSEMAKDGVPAQAVISSLNTLRDNPKAKKIHLFVFDTFASYNTFFARNLADPLTGETTWASGNTPNVYSAVVETNPESGNIFSDTILGEISVHEIGHAFSRVLDRQSSNADFSNLVVADLQALDFLDAASTQARPACVDTTRTAPFKGNSQVCNALNNQTAFLGQRNSAILTQINLGTYFFTQKLNDVGVLEWSELYAQSFSYEAFVKKLHMLPALPPYSAYGFVTPDQLFENSYFKCTREWTLSVANGVTTPSTLCTP